MSDDVDISKLVDNSAQKSKNGFADPTNNFPSEQYDNQSSTNLAARGLERHELYIGGAPADFDLGVIENNGSTYPLNQVKQSIAGHVVETDDTPGNERLLWKHKTGSGVEMKSDGTVIVSSRNNTITITGGDQKVLVEGDGELHYLGNLKLHVAGDMDVEVAGDYNLRVHGDKREQIDGGSSTTVTEDKIETVVGNKSLYVAENNTETVLGTNIHTVKGDETNRIGGNQNVYVGKSVTMTAPDDMNFTSKSINVAATDLSMIATTGVVGGDNVIYYGKNYYGTSSTFTHGVTAPTFHGDLQGTAVKSITSDVTNSQNYADPDPGGGTGSAQGYTAANTATDTTVRGSVAAPGPTSAIMDDYLNNSNLGVRNVDIDPGGVMKDTINKNNSYGGVAKSSLTTEMVRSKLRDPNTARNSKFIARAISEGVLSSKFVQQKPQSFEVGRILSSEGTSKYPEGEVLGNSAPPRERISSEVNTISTITFVPNQTYNPELQYLEYGVINGKTKLGRGISLSKFLGGYGDPVTLEHVQDDMERLQIARNLYVQSEFLQSAQDHLDKTNRHKLTVVEGLYKKKDTETLDPNSLNFLATRGQVVVYEVRDRTGQIDIEKTFDLAIYIKDNINYDKMIVDYDVYNPDNTLNAQLIVQMPPVNPDWKMRYRNEIETRFNNYSQTNGELMEIRVPLSGNLSQRQDNEHNQHDH
jgi:hypothetical protein